MSVGKREAKEYQFAFSLMDEERKRVSCERLVSDAREATRVLMHEAHPLLASDVHQRTHFASRRSLHDASVTDNREEGD